MNGSGIWNDGQWSVISDDAPDPAHAEPWKLMVRQKTENISWQIEIHSSSIRQASNLATNEHNKCSFYSSTRHFIYNFLRTFCCCPKRLQIIHFTHNFIIRFPFRFGQIENAEQCIAQTHRRKERDPANQSDLCFHHGIDFRQNELYDQRQCNASRETIIFDISRQNFHWHNERNRRHAQETNKQYTGQRYNRHPVESSVTAEIV